MVTEPWRPLSSAKPSVDPVPCWFISALWLFARSEKTSRSNLHYFFCSPLLFFSVNLAFISPMAFARLCAVFGGEDGRLGCISALVFPPGEKHS